MVHPSPDCAKIPRMMPRCFAALTLIAFTLGGGLAIRAQSGTRKFVPVTDAMLQKPDPADWLMWRRTLDGWGYSPLDQINRNNVAQLRMVWTRAWDPGNQEGTPLVHDGVMYVPSAGDYILAIDAKTGDVLWEYRAQAARRRERPRRTATLAIWGNMIINSSSDNFIYALDAQTGKLAWETPVLDPRKRAPTSGGPIIANGKVITGRQCQPDAGRDSCVVTAHDAQDRQGAVALPHDSADLASRTTNRGATCRWNSGGTSEPGWCRATIRS